MNKINGMFFINLLTKNMFSVFLPLVQNGREFNLRVTVQPTRIDAVLLRADQPADLREKIPDVPYVEMLSVQILRWDDKNELHLDHIHARFAEFGDTYREFWKGAGKKSLCNVLTYLNREIYNGALSGFILSLKALSSVGRARTVSVGKPSSMEPVIRFFATYPLGDSYENLVRYLFETPTKTVKRKLGKLAGEEYSEELLTRLTNAPEEPRAREFFLQLFELQPKMVEQLHQALHKYVSQRSLENYYEREYGMTVSRREFPPLPRQPSTWMTNSLPAVTEHCTL